jgi:hypothetical protein
MHIQRPEDVFELHVWKWATSPGARVLVSAKTGRRLVPADVRARLEGVAFRLQLRDVNREINRLKQREHFRERFLGRPRSHHPCSAERAAFAPLDEIAFVPPGVRLSLSRLGVDSLTDLLANPYCFYMLGVGVRGAECIEAALMARGLRLPKG